MPKLPPLTPQRIIKVLKKKGFSWIGFKEAITFISTRKRGEERLFHFTRKSCPGEHCLRFQKQAGIDRAELKKIL